MESSVLATNLDRCSSHITWTCTASLRQNFRWAVLRETETSPFILQTNVKNVSFAAAVNRRKFRIWFPPFRLSTRICPTTQAREYWTVFLWSYGKFRLCKGHDKMLLTKYWRCGLIQYLETDRRSGQRLRPNRLFGTNARWDWLDWTRPRSERFGQPGTILRQCGLVV